MRKWTVLCAAAGAMLAAVSGVARADAQDRGAWRDACLGFRATAHAAHRAMHASDSNYKGTDGWFEMGSADDQSTAREPGTTLD